MNPQSAMTSEAPSDASATGVPGQHATALIQEYLAVRGATLALCEPLEVEDTIAQSMPDASPIKWHLAHTSWFFETFLLSSTATDACWKELFNSYYQRIGPQFSRAHRGVLTRPTLRDVLAFRKIVDEAVLELLTGSEAGADKSKDGLSACDIVHLGLHHERQHQELMLTDLLHLFSLNPLEPVYRQLPLTAGTRRSHDSAVQLRFIHGRSGIVSMGHDGDGFAYDNECPRHQVILTPHCIANRPVNNGEFRAFIEAGGYQDPRLWLAEAWPLVQQAQWQRPLYWASDLQSSFTLRGRQALDPLAPVSHLSYFEARAFCEWAQARLPTEAEWESLAAAQPVSGNFVENDMLVPRAPVPCDAQGPGSGAPPEHQAPGVLPEKPLQLYGDVWEWTASPYVNYPGFKPLPGAAGEYNGKFMSGQYVLRGGSCVTPRASLRATYRNYFPPAARWQFSGLRLANDL